MASTKFRITMEIEVVDVGGVPAGVLALNKSISKATENISWSGNVNVTAIYVEKIGATGVTPKVVEKPFGDVNTVPKKTW